MLAKEDMHAYAVNTAAGQLTLKVASVLHVTNQVNTRALRGP